MRIPEDAGETVVPAGVVTAGEPPGIACDEGVNWVERGYTSHIFVGIGKKWNSLL